MVLSNYIGLSFAALHYSTSKYNVCLEVLLFTEKFLPDSYTPQLFHGTTFLYQCSTVERRCTLIHKWHRRKHKLCSIWYSVVYFNSPMHSHCCIRISWQSSHFQMFYVSSAHFALTALRKVWCTSRGNSPCKMAAWSTAPGWQRSQWIAYQLLSLCSWGRCPLWV